MPSQVPSSSMSWPSRAQSVIRAHRQLEPSQVPDASVSRVADLAPILSNSAVPGYAQYSSSVANWARATAARMLVVALRYCHRFPR